jgi:hypothetical protein
MGRDGLDGDFDQSLIVSVCMQDTVTLHFHLQNG